MSSAVLTQGSLQIPAEDLFSLDSSTKGAQLQDWHIVKETLHPIVVGEKLTSAMTTYCRRLLATAPAQSYTVQIFIPAIINQMSQEVEKEATKSPASLEVSRIMELTSLSRNEIAEKLLDVKRQSLWRWETEQGIKPENIGKITAVRDILERAYSAQVARSGRSDLKWWLFTPRGTSGITPQQLILGGEYAKARMLAATTVSEKHSAIPEWLRDRPINQRTAHLEQMLNTYDERDFHTSSPTSVAPEEN